MGILESGEYVANQEKTRSMTETPLFADLAHSTSRINVLPAQTSRFTTLHLSRVTVGTKHSELMEYAHSQGRTRYLMEAASSVPRTFTISVVFVPHALQTPTLTELVAYVVEV